MRRPFRILMLWLLLASLPLQGIAAAFASPCRMAHRPAGAAMHARASAARPDPLCGMDKHPAHKSCRGCCACHVASSAPPPFAAPGPVAPGFARDRIVPAPSSTGWIPSRIERPPRV